MSPPPVSTSPSKRRCCSCCATCGASWVWRFYWSPTIWRSWPNCVTACWSCTPGGWSKIAMSIRCSRVQNTRIPGSCCDPCRAFPHPVRGWSRCQAACRISPRCRPVVRLRRGANNTSGQSATQSVRRSLPRAQPINARPAICTHETVGQGRAPESTLPTPGDAVCSAAYGVRRGWVDLAIERGAAVGLIGESGSGKTTFGRTLLQLYPPTGGRIYVDGQDVTGAHGQALRALRRRMQMVFQNPYSAVNRRKTVAEIITEPLTIHNIGNRTSRLARGRELLDMVGLPSIFMARYPHEVSGGQLQRVGIARALALEPDFIVADEPTASLDVSIRAQVINLLAELRVRLGLTLLFISHDLSVVSYVCERVAVMYLGKIVEEGLNTEVEQHPLHPYTRALLGAIPRPDPRQRRLLSAPLGEIPSAVDRPAGCHYQIGRAHV